MKLHPMELHRLDVFWWTMTDPVYGADLANPVDFFMEE